MKPFYVLCIFLLLAGWNTSCSSDNNQAQDNDGLTTIQTNHLDQSLSSNAKKRVLEMKESKDAKAVNANQELLLAVQVKQFDRFQIDRIEKKIQNNLEQVFPNKKLHVSTDLKIFMETNKLEKSVQKGTTGPKKLKKEMQRIKHLMKEKT